jgi:hypothetical protein
MDTYKFSKTPVFTAAQEGGTRIEVMKHGTCIYSAWGHLTWPEKFDADLIALKYKESGAVGFARMYLLDLEAAKGHVLKRDWITTYPHEDIGQDWPVFIGIDYASTQDKLRQKDRDYFAAAWGKLAPSGVMVIIDGIREQISQAEAEKRIVALVSQFPRLRHIGIESIGKGEEFYVLLQRAPVFMPLIPIPSHKGEARTKGGRFEKVLAKMFQFGRIAISSKTTPFLASFLDEWLSWDGTQKAHDDTLDAIYMLAKAAEGYLPIPQIQAAPRSPLWEPRERAENVWAALGKSHG